MSARISVGFCDDATPEAVKLRLTTTGEPMLTAPSTHPEYDFSTAVTFLSVGLFLGAILAVLISPLKDSGGVSLPPRSRRAAGAERDQVLFE
jgi:hypothetical protein